MSPDPTTQFGRVDYTLGGLPESDLTADPMDLFTRWYDEAGSAVEEPNAMVVSTVAGDRPSSRTVLLKGLDGGFTFFTNYRSRKAAELGNGAWCALLFPWYALQRQVRVEGTVAQVSREQSEAYFATRPRGSQLGAWASVEPVPQSGVVADREALDASYAAVEARFDGGDVPCPPTWGGYVVTPEVLEFWQGRHGRMHDRLRYRRAEDGANGSDGPWTTERLAP